MTDVIGAGAQDLTQLLSVPQGADVRRGDPRAQLFQILQYVIENLVYHMTEIMVGAFVFLPSVESLD